ncbi:MAG: hypothetical protein JW928_00655 [Candidatus Aureabacteria bacterium]|nr:hypothetical protein [Candidatus Auribacterota bacterium]
MMFKGKQTVTFLEPEVQDVLKSAGLIEARDFFSYKNKYCYKRNYFRAVYKIPLQDRKNIFLKKHDRLSPAMFLRLLFVERLSEARHELESILLARKLGIATLKPLGYGEKTIFGIPVQSFLLTESLEKVPRLEDIIAKSWNKFPFAKKKFIISSVAEIVAKLHRNRLFHKDLYLGHILFDDAGSSDECVFYLIDLQRINQHNKRLRRWRVKDLSSLNYSADLCGVGIKDRLRFLKEYCRHMKLPSRDYIRPVNRKTELIKNHTLKRYLKNNLKKKTR